MRVRTIIFLSFFYVLFNLFLPKAGFSTGARSSVDGSFNEREKFERLCFCCGKSWWKTKIQGKSQRKRYKILECCYCRYGIINPFPLVKYDEMEVEFYIKNQNLFMVYMVEIIDILMEYKQKGVLLDIGANIGLLVAEAKKRGFVAKGVELSKKAVEFGKKRLHVEYYQKDIYALKRENAFDAVTMNHVLEHIENPKLFLKEVHRIMKPTGVLVVAVPNCASISARIFRGHWSSLCPEAHISYFTSGSLQKLLLSEHFRIRKVVINEPYREYKWTLRSILRRILLGPFYYLCDKIGSGRNLIIVAEKIEKED